MRLTALSALTFVLSSSGCCWLFHYHCPPPPDLDYGATATAVRAAETALQGMYRQCFPDNYDRESFFKDLEDPKLDFSDKNLSYLRLAEVDVWPEEDCTGYVLVAYRLQPKRVMLWDLASTNRIDGQGRDEKPPVEPYPPRKALYKCTCKP
jgi:hypothetical protein